MITVTTLRALPFLISNPQVSTPNCTLSGVDGGIAKKTTTFADSENTAPSSTAPAPLKPRARVVSARNVVSARLTTQAGSVLAAYQAAVGGGNEYTLFISCHHPSPSDMYGGMTTSLLYE